ncbi:MAG: hypothetical protein ACYC2K_14495, partial [Gemmatimonadales bacterium]
HCPVQDCQHANAQARALQLGFREQAALLEQTLTDEMTAHETLSMVADALSFVPAAPAQRADAPVETADLAAASH